MADRVTQLEQELHYWDGIVQANSRNPNAFVRRGMVQFKLGQIAASIRDFDQAEKIDARLTPYLWQRGLAYYYDQQYEAGAGQFELDLTVNGQDVEETVWRYLCLAQSRGVEQAIARLLPVHQDPRPFMRRVYDLYAAQCSLATFLAEVERENQQGRFYRHLYAGLYAEVHQDEDTARHHLAIAVEQYPLDDYMWHLAIVHRQVRGWL